MRPYFYLHVPEGDPEFRIMAIDPGTSTLGVSILTSNLITSTITVEYADTLIADNMVGPYVDLTGYYDSRFIKLHAMQKSLAYLMREFNVHAVVSESPYLGRFPQAFAALTEAMCMIRRAIMEYSPYTSLHTIDPATIKMLCGVSGKSSDKALMQRAILNLHATGHLMISESVNLEILDEHSIDSIGAGYAHLNW